MTDVQMKLSGEFKPFYTVYYPIQTFFYCLLLIFHYLKILPLYMKQTGIRIRTVVCIVSMVAMVLINGTLAYLIATRRKGKGKTRPLEKKIIIQSTPVEILPKGTIIKGVPLESATHSIEQSEDRNPVILPDSKDHTHKSESKPSSVIIDDDIDSFDGELANEDCEEKEASRLNTSIKRMEIQKLLKGVSTVETQRGLFSTPSDPDIFKDDWDDEEYSTEPTEVVSLAQKQGVRITDLPQFPVKHRLDIKARDQYNKE